MFEINWPCQRNWWTYSSVAQAETGAKVGEAHGGYSVSHIGSTK